MNEALTNRVVSAAMREMGEPITYPREGVQYSIRGLFSSAYTGIENGIPISVNTPVLTINRKDVSFDPRDGDQVLIRGINYRVRDTQEDGGTGVALQLQRTDARSS